MLIGLIRLKNSSFWGFISHSLTKIIQTDQHATYLLQLASCNLKFVTKVGPVRFTGSRISYKKIEHLIFFDFFFKCYGSSGSRDM